MGIHLHGTASVLALNREDAHKGHPYYHILSSL